MITLREQKSKQKSRRRHFSLIGEPHRTKTFWCANAHKNKIVIVHELLIILIIPNDIIDLPHAEAGSEGPDHASKANAVADGGYNLIPDAIFIKAKATPGTTPDSYVSLTCDQFDL